MSNVIVALPLLLLTSLLMLATGVDAQKTNPEQPAGSDEQDIRKTILGVERAWNAHDMHAYANLLRDDVEWVNIVGMHWRGKKEVMAAHIAFHKTTFKNHHLHTDAIEVRLLSDGIAIAVVTTTNDAFIAPDGREFSKAQDRQTYVLVKEKDGWKIAHCENVRVDPVAANHDPVHPPRPKP